MFGTRDEVIVQWKLALNWDQRVQVTETPFARVSRELAEARARIAELESRLSSSTESESGVVDTKDSWSTAGTGVTRYGHLAGL